MTGEVMVGAVVVGVVVIRLVVVEVAGAVSGGEVDDVVIPLDGRRFGQGSACSDSGTNDLFGVGPIRIGHNGVDSALKVSFVSWARKCE
jgi:hypothetical protein